MSQGWRLFFDISNACWGGGFVDTPAGSSTSFTNTGLPSGLSLDDSTGVVTGTPVTAGNYLVDITERKRKKKGTFGHSDIRTFGHSDIHCCSEQTALLTPVN
jgi:Putative Ig domain